MNQNENMAMVQSVLWVVLGALAVLLFFLPLYGSAVYELNGIDTIDFVRDMDTDKIKRYDKLTGILMISVPVLGLLNGFLGVVFGVSGLVSRKPGRGLALAILGGVTMLLGAVCAAKLDGQASGFFGAFFPKAIWGFYVLLFLQVCLGGVGPLMGLMGKR